MAEELSLLWKIKADATQVKTATAESRAAVAQLRQSFGPELAQTVSVTNKAFSEISDNLNVFIGQRIPLIGGSFIRITENIRGLGTEAQKQEVALRKVAEQITSLSQSTGKSVPQITGFLTQFAKIETQANRDAAAIKFFGAELIANNAKLIPQAEKTAAALGEIAVASEGAATGLGALANPIAIIIAALIAQAAAAALVAKALFDLTKRASEFEGKMFDLAQQTGVAVETLSALEIVAKTTGGEIGNITQSLINFQRKLEDAQDPLSKTAGLFRDLKIDTGDTETALRQSLSALAGMQEGFEQTNAATELFGARGGKQLLAILKETNGDLDGAIKRFRELGILISEDDARAADKLNDELAILDFQLRAASAVIARELIPAFVEVVRAVGNIVTAARPLLNVIGQIAGPIVRGAASALRGLGIVVAALTLNFVALKKAKEEADAALLAPPIPPQTTEGPQAVGLPSLATVQQATAAAAAQADIVVTAAKRAAEKTNQALDELFQKGRANREQQVNEVIEGNKKVLDAERLRIQAQLKLKDEEVKGLRDNKKLTEQERVEEVNKVFQDADKLHQELLDKEAQFEVEAKALRAKAAKERADSRRNQIANDTEILLKEFDNQIKATEAAIKRGEQSEADGLTTIEALEKAKIEFRLQGLEDQKRVGFLTIEEQKSLNAEIQKLNQEADHLEDEHRQRRLDRERAVGERTRDILIANIAALLEVERVQGEARIATLQALAAARVKTEEDAAKEILRVRLQLIDSEIEAAKTQLSATGSIVDVAERAKAEADLNNQIRILNAQRAAIQAEGSREIEAGRQKDLDNERRYQDELIEVKERTIQIEREAAEEVIRLMIIHFASRRDIIRARLQFDIEDENARHRNAQQGIAALRQENLESNRTKEEKLEQEREINLLEEAEAERHRLALQGIQDQGKADEDEASPLGRIGLDIENLREFASVIEETIVPLGEILTNTFQRVADAIGQTVANWVLLGETGPAVMRKILAQALASVAAEAAVNAIKELALGFATLFFNPAASAAHFTSAALWGSIAGVAAIAGRGVAGDLFKQKGSAGGGDGRGGSGELNPLNLARNAGPGSQQQIAPQIQPLRVEISVNDSTFGRAITAHVVNDVNNAGPIREVIAGDGNLNRG